MQGRRTEPDGVARLTGSMDAPRLWGEVRFYQRKNCVLIEAEVRGLPRNTGTGFFGFHIHEGRSCSGPEFADTGGHYNPGGEKHPNHAGDLPPLLLCNGTAWLSVTTDRFSLREVLGRTVVIHRDSDDFTSQPSGNSGRKIACGVIRTYDPKK